MSEKTVAQKLGIKAGQSLALLNAPEGYRETLRGLPKDVKVFTSLVGPADVVQCFVASKKELDKALPELKAALSPKTILWIAYPKGTSGVKTDIHRDIIRQAAAALGMNAVALFSIDDTWSSLRLKIG
ncbi:MAG: DUF3052 family protein [Planctomycetes bacterium]|nr:DUF3052 family protein [Planctomycetota bacterium]